MPRIICFGHAHGARHAKVQCRYSGDLTPFLRFRLPAKASSRSELCISERSPWPSNEVPLPSAWHSCTSWPGCHSPRSSPTPAADCGLEICNRLGVPNPFRRALDPYMSRLYVQAQDVHGTKGLEAGWGARHLQPDKQGSLQLSQRNLSPM